MRHCPNPECSGLARDGRVAEFADGIEACLDCGVRLIAGPAIEPREEPALEFHELATVHVASGRVQGRVVAGLLEASGIPAFLKGEMLAGAIGELPTTVEQLEVQVPFERAEEAQAIVADYERGALALEPVDLWEPELD